LNTSVQNLKKRVWSQFSIQDCLKIIVQKPMFEQRFLESPRS